jgi:5-methylcytosine-specific restriction endonuclease McrA
MKICSRCGIEKPFSEFYKNRVQPDGLDYYCKACNKEYRHGRIGSLRESKEKYRRSNLDKFAGYQRNWRAANPKKLSESNRIYKLLHPEIKQGNELVRRSRKENAGDTLTKEQLEIIFSFPCIICGSSEEIQLAHDIPISREGTTSFDNCVSLCGNCNRHMHTKTISEYLDVENAWIF